MPSKYVRPGSSLIGLAAEIAKLRRDHMSVSDLWSATQSTGIEVSYDNFIASLDILYALGAVSIEGGTLHWGRRDN